MPAPTVTSVSPPIHPTNGGTSIAITGTGFTGATGVTIGGVAATSLVVVNDTTITCTVPAGAAGTASVLVTTAGGTNGANTLAYYVAGVPADIYVYLSGGRGDGYVPNWTGVVTDVIETEAGDHYRDIFRTTISRSSTVGGYNGIIPGVAGSGTIPGVGSIAITSTVFPAITEGNSTYTVAPSVSKESDEVAHTAPRAWTKSVTWSHFLSSNGLSYKFKKSLITGIGSEPRDE